MSKLQELHSMMKKLGWAVPFLSRFKLKTHLSLGLSVVQINSLKRLTEGNMDLGKSFYQHSKVLVAALNGPAIGLSAGLLGVSSSLLSLSVIEPSWYECKVLCSTSTWSTVSRMPTFWLPSVPFLSFAKEELQKLSLVEWVSLKPTSWVIQDLSLFIRQQRLTTLSCDIEHCWWVKNFHLKNCSNVDSSTKFSLVRKMVNLERLSSSI